MMTAKRRPNRRFLIPAVGIAIVLLLVLLRPVSLARPEAQNPAKPSFPTPLCVLQ